MTKRFRTRERSVTPTVDPTPPSGDKLLLEDAFKIQLESGDFILLEV